MTINHEDIPGVMKGMEMNFNVDDPGILSEMEVGDQVRGRLRVKDGDYTITKLEKQ